MTFIEQVEDLIGDQDSGLDTAILQYLTASAREVQSVLPPRLKMRYGTENVLNNGNGLDIADKEAVNIERNGRSVSEVPLGNKADVIDVNSLHFATNRTPIYYMQGTTLIIKPDPSATEVARLYTLSYPTVASNDTTIQIQSLTPLYTQELQRLGALV